MPNDTEKRLPNINRFDRCIFPCADPSGLSQISQVLMAGPEVSVQYTPIRSVAVTFYLQDSPPNPAVGTSQRDSTLSLPRRSDHHGTDNGTIATAHSIGSREASIPRLSEQLKEVLAGSDKDTGTPWVSDQHHQDDTLSPSNQSQRHALGSFQDPQQGLYNLENPPLIRGQGHGNDSGSVPSQTDVSRSPRSLERSAQGRIILDKHYHPQPGRHDGPLLVDRATLAVERNIVDSLPTQMDIYTDASDEGWGIIIGSQTWKGSWTATERDLHINFKELQAIYLAIKLPVTQGKVFNMICDNTTTIAYINKFGGTRSPQLMALADKIWQHCLATGTRLRTTYIPSAFNPADSPSRRMMQQLEWKLDRSFFQYLDYVWDPHHLDLLASVKNHQLPTFFSWKPHPKAAATDAMHQQLKSWGHLYICPPWNFLTRVLERLRQEKLEATVIAPFWPTAAWFPTIQEMALEPPLPVPRHLVLAAQENEKSILDKNAFWNLSAWRLSGRG